MINSISVVLVHTGNAPLPDYLINTILVTARIAPSSRLYILTSRLHHARINSILKDKGLIASPQVALIAIDDVLESSVSNAYRKNSSLDRDFRGGFWFSASDRFFVLADFMEMMNLHHCLHIENDVLLYLDPTTLIEQFKNFADFAVPLDRIRAIPGVVWLKTPEVARRLTEFISCSTNQNDMATLGEFCLGGLVNAKPLPTIPTSYAKSKQLDPLRYCQGIEEFGGIFDGAAIGQYLGGIHWMNDPGDTRFFINESSDLHLNEFSFDWESKGNRRQPVLGFQDEYTRVLNVHAHSKDLLGMSPFNCFDGPVNSMLTPGLVESLADVSLTSSALSKHQGPRDGELNTAALKIPEKKKTRFFMEKTVELVPDVEFLQACRGAKVFLINPLLLNYFKQYIAPRLDKGFILISTDLTVGFEDLALLNYPHLLAWYTQKSEISHSKLKPLPMGVSDSISLQNELILLGNRDSNLAINASRKLLYVSLPNPKALPASLDAVVRKLSSITQDIGAPTEGHIKQLMNHQFCLLINEEGVSQHLFWEAQYLNCIPIVRMEDWNPAFSGLPILLIHKWADLLDIDLEQVYVKISTTHFDRSSLALDFYQSQISSLLT
jgi:hypothetical protein